MKKIKILTVVGTRPELIRISRIISSMDKFFTNVLVHTNQNFDKNLNDIFFKDMKIRKPNYFFKNNKKTKFEFLGEIFNKIDKIIKKEKPDGFFILGDTNSCLSAYVAKRNKIPIFHFEAGNRSYDENVPEEINRKIIDHISDINFTYSENSKQNLIREGLNPEFVFNIGSPMFEVLNYYSDKINKSKILDKLNLKKNKYIVVSTHREENLQNREKFENFIKNIFKIAKKLDLEVVFSTHPRTRKLINRIKIKIKKNVFLNPLNFTDYNSLQKDSYIVLSDSGTINEESSILNFDAINLRDNHERHEAMENAITIMTKFSENNILNAIKILKNTKSKFSIIEYQQNNVSSKIVRLIQSYIHKINKKIYFKSD